MKRQRPLFERDGTELHCEVPDLRSSQAALGAEIEAPTLEGRVKMTDSRRHPVGEGAAPARQGAPAASPAQRDPQQLARMRGDLFVRIFVEVPTKLNAVASVELLEEFAQETGTEVSPASKGFMDKLREIFD